MQLLLKITGCHSVFSTLLHRNDKAAEVLLDQCITTNEQELDSSDLLIVYDLEIFKRESESPEREGESAEEQPDVRAKRAVATEEAMLCAQNMLCTQHICCARGITLYAVHTTLTYLLCTHTGGSRISTKVRRTCGSSPPRPQTCTRPTALAPPAGW